MAPYVLTKDGLSALIIVSAFINEGPLTVFTHTLSVTTLDNNPNWTFILCTPNILASYSQWLSLQQFAGWVIPDEE